MFSQFTQSPLLKKEFTWKPWSFKSTLVECSSKSRDGVSEVICNLKEVVGSAGMFASCMKIAEVSYFEIVTKVMTTPKWPFSFHRFPFSTQTPNDVSLRIRRNTPETRIDFVISGQWTHRLSFVIATTRAPDEMDYWVSSPACQNINFLQREGEENMRIC